jgi:hypothetical protein
MSPSLRTLPRILSSLLLFALCGTNLFAERLPIKVYTSADGLNTSASFHIARDSRGFIWICSRDGLIRFDGYRFITYRIGSDDADPAVFSLLPTSKDVYWVNLNRGTDYRFIDKGDATLIQPLPPQQSRSDPRVPLAGVEPVSEGQFPTFEDSRGNLWGYERRGLNLFREVQGKSLRDLIEVKLPGNPAGGLTNAGFAQGSDEAFWVSTNSGIIRRLPDGRIIYYSVASKNIRHPASPLAEDKENRLWITHPDGILVLKVEPVAQLANVPDLETRLSVVKKGQVNAAGEPVLPTQAGEASLFSFQDMFRRDIGTKPAANTNRPYRLARDLRLGRPGLDY